MLPQEAKKFHGFILKVQIGFVTVWAIGVVVKLLLGTPVSLHLRFQLSTAHPGKQEDGSGVQIPAAQAGGLDGASACPSPSPSCWEPLEIESADGGSLPLRRNKNL